MCLAVKYKTKFNGNKGWKLLFKTTGKGYATGLCGAKIIRLNKREFTGLCEAGIPTLYTEETGFYHTKEAYQGAYHIFTRKRDAVAIQEYHVCATVCQVEFKDQVAYGCTHWACGVRTRTVVAKQCKVIKEE